MGRCDTWLVSHAAKAKAPFGATLLNRGAVEIYFHGGEQVSAPKQEKRASQEPCAPCFNPIAVVSPRVTRRFFFLRRQMGATTEMGWLQSKVPWALMSSDLAQRGYGARSTQPGGRISRCHSGQLRRQTTRGAWPGSTAVAGGDGRAGPPLLGI